MKQNLSLEGCKNSIMLEEKSSMSFEDLEKALDRVPRKVVEWTMRKKGIPEVLVRSATSLYEGAKTSQRGTRSKMGCTNDLCCHLFFWQLL